MKNLKIYTNNADETINLGRIVARSLGPGCGILFEGDLGTGKTTFISGICGGLGVKQTVKSPSFVLVWAYQGENPVYHVDLYRLTDYDELENIGWEEIVDESAIYLVEWADRFHLPYTEGALRMKMEYGETPEKRELNFFFDEAVYPNLERDLEDYENSRN